MWDRASITVSIAWRETSESSREGSVSDFWDSEFVYRSSLDVSFAGSLRTALSSRSASAFE